MHAVAPRIPPGDVVGVDERDGRAPGAAGALGSEPPVELVRYPAVHLPALPRGTVRRGIHTAVEAVALERLGPGRRRPVVVVMGEVPLPQPARAVAVLAEHRPPRGKARVQGARPRDHAAGLVGVQPGHERRTRRGAVVRGRVVVSEGDGAGAKGLDVGRQLHGGRRGQPLRVAHLVDDDHEDVRLLAAGPRGAASPDGPVCSSRLASSARALIARPPATRRRQPGRP